MSAHETTTVSALGRDAGSAAPMPAAGSLIAGRYRLGDCIGRGAHGVVWEAEDELAKRAVAVKLLNSGVGIPLPRIQLEIAALRQRVPGVVELLDDGVEEEDVYLVLELVRGLPFPGVKGRPCAWDEIAQTTAALLETLARVHSVSLVHRDLKPWNVLVTSEGKIRVLDFGIAYRTDSAETASIDREGSDPLPAERSRSDRVTAGGDMVGTPAYAAPEQLRDGSVDERTDLYAVGVMLYEALSGSRPHAAISPHGLLRAKLLQVPPSLAEVAPHVPVAVAKVVDQLLEIEAAARPASATQVLELLSGEPSVQASFIPWLGPLEPLEKLASAARADESIDVVGPPGSGRTRCLLAFAELAEWKDRVVHLPAGEHAFESLAPLVGDVAQDHEDASPEEVASIVDARLRQALHEGRIPLADDAEQLDRSSALALARCSGEGTIVRAFQPGSPGLAAPAERRVELVPLRAEHLRILFAGPDLLLHLREDAARVLHLRTGGSPAGIVREITTWIRLGVAHWLRNLLVVQRDAIDRLESGVLAAAPIQMDRAEHAALAEALPPGTRGRLQHLILGATKLEQARVAIGQEAQALAERLIDEGRLGEAIATIESGLRHLRGLGEAVQAETERLVGLWVEAAIEDGMPHALDRLLYASSRLKPRTATIERLEALARAERGLEEWSDRPLARVGGVAAFDDPRLERVRYRVVLRAARRVKDDQVEERILDQIVTSTAPATPDWQATLDTWRGRLRYRQGRFREAADLHARAAQTTSDVRVRIYSQMTGAMALMEAFAFPEAGKLAAKTIALAAEHRHASCEAIARWVARAVAYRTGAAHAPDRELAVSVPYVGLKELEATICMNEAAIAWRAGDGDAARELAGRALEIFTTIGIQAGVLISRGLLLLHGERASDSEVRDLCKVAVDDLLPGVGIQGLGLLALASHLPAGAVDEAAIARLADTVPRTFWGVRMDVLSVEESLGAISAARLSRPGARRRVRSLRSRGSARSTGWSPARKSPARRCRPS